MFNIDQFAYSNRLRSSHPGEKFAFSIVSMIICIAFNSLITSLAAILIMAGAIVFMAGIPWRFYLRLMSLPLAFLLVGVFTVAISFTRTPDIAMHGFTLMGVTIGFTPRDLNTAAGLFFKSLGAVSCLYFLSLTTPMVEIISILRKMRFPSLFIELMEITYRFIFVMSETACKIYRAQSSRWGYSGFRASCQSLGQLTASLFIKSYHRSQECFNSLMSRCYNGELNVIETQYRISKRNIIMIAAMDSALLILALHTGGDMIGRFYP